MKKILFVAVVAFVFAVSFQSCKSTVDCPAYGQGKVEQAPVQA